MPNSLSAQLAELQASLADVQNRLRQAELLAREIEADNRLCHEELSALNDSRDE